MQGNVSSDYYTTPNIVSSKEQQISERLVFLQSLKNDIINFVANKVGRPVTPNEITIIFKDVKISLADLGALLTMKRAVAEQRLDLTAFIADILSEVKQGTVMQEVKSGKIYVKTSGTAHASPDMPVADSQYLPFLRQESNPADSNIRYMEEWKKNEQKGTNTEN